MRRLACLLMTAFWACLSASAFKVDNPRFVTFEDDSVLSVADPGRGSVAITDKRFREGSRSLEWTFREGDALSFRMEAPFEAADPTGKDTYLSTFIIWVRSERPFDSPMKFEFLKEGRVCCSFPMGMAFTGWRAVWVTFERDMDGTPEEGMDEIRILPPAREGTICLDHLITATKVDSRYQSPDAQAPFVNRETENHWLLIYKNSLKKADLPLERLDDALKEDIRIVESRFEEVLYERKPVTGQRLESLRRRFSFYEIRRDADGRITGRPVFMIRHIEAYERLLPGWNKDLFRQEGVDFGAYFTLMRDVAMAYSDSSSESEKDELKAMFLDLYDLITEFGAAAGSSWGYCHHYGYDLRGMYPAYFLMRDVLRESGRLEQAAETLLWYAVTNETLEAPKTDGIIIDDFNTQLEGRLASILLMEDSPEKVRYLRSFARWIDRGCRPAPGLAGSFKPDGACFHHANNYPAYAVGGLDGAVRAIWFLSGTAFAIPELPHETVRKCLLAMRFYSNRLQWPLSMSGRHPNGGWQLAPGQYAYMALAGTPDGKSPVDTLMARAFLRLTTAGNSPDKAAKGKGRGTKLSSFERKTARDLRRRGFTPENDPEGNMSIAYGCTSVHRRGGWMALVRGHSRYLWATEQYLAANWYGRYLGYGGLEIMTAPPGEVPSLATSLWQEAGFDWNRIPGVTSVHLPWELLRARVLNVDSYSGFEEMLFSDEAFAGGLSSAGWNGNFVMKVHGHDKYDGTLRARKSYHFINGMIVCLGSDIEDGDSGHRTETTVFQAACMKPGHREFWQDTSGDCNVPGGRCFIDPNGTGYCLSAESAVNAAFIPAFPQEGPWERKEGLSHGDWVSLVLDHGAAPSGAGYEYAVLPGTDRSALAAFAKKPSCKVLRRDRGAHVVSSGGICSYVCFEAHQSFKGGTVAAVDTSALVMTSLEGKGLLLTVAQPDLALYRGPADEVYGPDGKRVERSIYSRPWFNNESQEIPVSVTLRGRWTLSADCPGVEVAVSGGRTRITVPCKDGRSYDLKLTRI